MKFIAPIAFAVVSAHAATILFVTPPNSTISSGTIPVSAQVTFIMSANQVEIRIANLQQETIGTVAQTISAMDWTFGSSVPVLPVQIARSGTMINLNSGSGNTPVAYSTITNGYASYSTDRWHSVRTSSQITGGLEITTLSGGNPDETIIGPPNANNLYQSNGGLRGDNPFLQTVLGSYVSWTLQFDPSDHITATTEVTRVRMSWNTAFASSTELDLIPGTPEPGVWVLCLSGLLGIAAWRRNRHRELLTSKRT